MKIDETSPVHPYVQLAGFLRADIQAGKITHQIPSITDLTEEYGLAVGTVRRSVKILVDEGLVKTVPGRGTFVVDKGSRGASGGKKGPGRPHDHVSH